MVMDHSSKFTAWPVCAEVTSYIKDKTKLLVMYGEATVVFDDGSAAFFLPGSPYELHSCALHVTLSTPLCHTIHITQHHMATKRLHADSTLFNFFLPEWRLKYYQNSQDIYL